MKLKNRRRFNLEQLEERCTPTITVNSGLLPDSNGNLNVNLTTTGEVFTVAQTGLAQITLSDDAGGSLAINGVFGNINITAATTDPDAFEGRLRLNPSFGPIGGNVTLSFSRLAGTTAVNADVDVVAVAGVGTILGSLTINTTVAAASTVDVSPTDATRDLQIFGNLSINTTGGTIAQLKTVTVANSVGDVTINGSLNAPNVNSFALNTDGAGAASVAAWLNATTRSRTAGDNTVTLGAAGGTTAIGNVSLNLGNAIATVNGNTVLFNDDLTVTGFISVKGGYGDNDVTFATTFASFGRQIVFTTKNGNSSLTFNGTAPLAALTASFGNGTNTVSFGATSSLASATLIGGLGSNTVSGTISFPLRLFRFSF